MVDMSLLHRAFTETLPALGLTQQRPAQLSYALMIHEQLIRAVRGPGDEAVRPQFAAIEADTGVGKTVGYLIPVLLHLAETGETARVTTHTLALQDQIYGREALYGNRQPDFDAGDRSDLAIALKVVQMLTGKNLRAGFRKGRQTYLSPVGAINFIKLEKKTGIQRTPEDQAIMNDLSAWAQSMYQLYLLQESMASKEKSAKEKIALEQTRQAFLEVLNADPYQGLIGSFMDAHEGQLPKGVCAADICMLPKLDDNPFYRHHRSDDSVDILIVSHALSLINLYTKMPVLPPAHIVIHDEADTLASVAEMYSRKKIRFNILHHALQKAWPGQKKNGWQSLGPVLAPKMASLDQALEDVDAWFSGVYQQHNPSGKNLSPVSDIRLHENTSLTRSAMAHLTTLRHCVTAIVDYWNPLHVTENADQETSKNNEPKENAAKNSGKKAKKSKKNISVNVLRFSGLLDQVKQEIDLAFEAYPVRDFGLDIRDDGLPKAQDACVSALGLTWTPVRRFPAIELVNLYASRLFSKEWFFKSHVLKNVILTSATLRSPDQTKGDWAYMIRVLGMPKETVGQAVAVAHFGHIEKVYRAYTSAKPFLGRDKLDRLIYNPDWIDGVKQSLLAMLHTKELGLVLTPSFLDVQTILEAFQDDRIWYQTDSEKMHWKDGVKALQSGRHQIMFTPSVWAGANMRDVHGGQLFRHLGFARRPSLPVDEVREKMLTHYLSKQKYSRPAELAHWVVQQQSIHGGRHKMTQGIGRGIRAADDAIQIWLMDARLESVSWQNTFPERFRDVFQDPARFHVFGEKPGSSSKSLNDLKKKWLEDA